MTLSLVKFRILNGDHLEKYVPGEKLELRSLMGGDFSKYQRDLVCELDTPLRLRDFLLQDFEEDTKVAEIAQALRRILASVK